MTPKEIKKLISWAAAAFPGMQEKNLGPTAELWHKMLSDLPYEVAEKALVKVLSSAKFFPTVAEIREAAVLLTRPMMPTHSEAWGLVRQAIWDYSAYREKDALEALPPVVSRVVKDIGWREICLSEEPDIIRAQFRKAYEVHCKREAEMSVLPAPLRELCEAGAQHFTLEKPKRPMLPVFTGERASTETALYHLNEMKKVLLETLGQAEPESVKYSKPAGFDGLIDQLKQAEAVGDGAKVAELLRTVQETRTAGALN